MHSHPILDQIGLYKEPRKSPDAKSLDGVFDFCLDPQEKGFKGQWWTRSLRSVCSHENFYRMPVPSAFNDITSNSTVQNYVGWFWYQTTIHSVHKPLDDSKWYLRFDSVNYLALVWVHNEPEVHPLQQNRSGLFVGSHVGGHLPFMLPIEETSSAGVFKLTIAVSNRLTEETIPSGFMSNLTQIVGREYYKFQPDFDFFHYSGIMGGIDLFKLPRTHISHVSRLNIDDFEKVHLNVCLSTESFEGLELAFMWYKLDQDKINLTTVSNLSSQCTLVSLVMNGPTWTLSEGKMNVFNEPLLLSISLNSSARRLDNYELKVFLRKGVQFDPTRGLRVDGQARQLQGFGMHQEQLFSGRSMSQATIAKDMYLLKKMGANLIRTSHYPYSEAYLEACDEHGLLVVAECPAVGLRSFSWLKLLLHQQILREMMQRDHHHPSIVMWSVANEPSSQLEPAASYFESLLNYSRRELAQYTKGRSLTAAIAQPHQVDKIGHTLDVIMVNHYFGWYDYAGVVEAVRLPLVESLKGWKRKYPGRGLILSEFGADTIAGLHSNEATVFSEEYQRDLLKEHEQVFDELYTNRSTSLFLGSMAWNFADFSTHQSLMRAGGNRKGLFTRDRQPKMGAHTLQKLYLARINRSPQLE